MTKSYRNKLFFILTFRFDEKREYLIEISKDSMIRQKNETLMVNIPPSRTYYHFDLNWINEEIRDCASLLMPEEPEFYMKDFYLYESERSPFDDIEIDGFSNFLRCFDNKDNVLSVLEFIANKKLAYINDFLFTKYTIESFNIKDRELSLLEMNSVTFDNIDPITHQQVILP